MSIFNIFDIGFRCQGGENYHEKLELAHDITIILILLLKVNQY